MKRVIYLVVAALVATVIIAPFAAAQGENEQQVQERLQQAQDKVLEAQAYMQSPEGQQALEEARTNLQEAGQQLQKAREGAQEKMQEVTTKMERTGLVKSGGVALSEPGLMLPAAALLLGSGILGYAVLRRRR
jgi:F0F1-type ATP synthase membrane subunit b/b'